MLTNLHNKLTSKINCRTTLTRHKRQRIIFIRTVRFLCKLRQNHDLNLLLKIVRWNETFFHCDETLSRMISSSTRNRKELFVLQCNPEFKNRSGFDFFLVRSRGYYLEIILTFILRTQYQKFCLNFYCQRTWYRSWWGSAGMGWAVMFFWEWVNVVLVSVSSSTPRQ